MEDEMKDSTTSGYDEMVYRGEITPTWRIEMEIDIIKLIDELENKVRELRTELTKRFPMCPYAEDHRDMTYKNGRCPWCGENIRGDWDCMVG
jgi:hypothetical protein